MSLKRKTVEILAQPKLLQNLLLIAFRVVASKTGTRAATTHIQSPSCMHEDGDKMAKSLQSVCD